MEYFKKCSLYCFILLHHYGLTSQCEGNLYGLVDYVEHMAFFYGTFHKVFLKQGLVLPPLLHPVKSPLSLLFSDQEAVEI